MEGDYKDDFKNALQFSTVPKVEPSEEVFILPGEFSENIPTAFPALPPPNVDKEDPLAENTTGDDSYKLKDSEVKDCLQNLLTIKTEEIKVELEDHCSQETQPVDKSSILHEDEHSSYELNTILPNKRKRALWIPQNISPVVPGTGPIPRKKQKNYAEDEITSPSESDNSDESYDPKTSLGDQSSPSESDSDYSYNPKRSIGSHTKKKQSSKGKKQPMKPVLAKEKLVGDSSNKNKGAISIPQIDSLPLLSEAAPSGKEKNKEWKLNDDSSNKQRGAISIPQHGSLPLVREAAPPWKKNKEGKMKWFLWSCCNKQFEEFSIFYKHKMQEHQIEEFRCSVCTDKLFTSLKDIEQHYLDIHTDSTWISYYCLDCRLLFGVKSSFDDHKAKCTESRVVCSKILDSMINFAVRRKKIKCQKPDGCKLCCCEKIFGNFEDFIAHKFSVHKIDLLTCGLCSYKKGSKMQLKYHYRKFHFPNYWDEMELESLRDKEAFPGSILTSRALEEMLNASGENNISQTQQVECTALQDGALCQCFACTLSLTQMLESTDDSKINQQSIFTKMAYHCDMCSTQFTSKVSINLHMKNVHGTVTGSYFCTECDKSFLLKDNFQRHLHLIHGKRRKMEPPNLNRTLVSKEREESKSSKPDSPSENEQKPEQFHSNYPCNKCDKHFTMKKNLIRHLKIHTGVSRSVTCNECGVVVTHKDKLSYHQIFVCPANRDRFSSVTLGSAPKTSTREDGDDEPMDQPPETSLNKPTDESVAKKMAYRCDMCSTEFTTKDSMHRHMKTMHGTETSSYLCTECDKSFLRKDNFQRHLQIHEKTAETCNKCGAVMLSGKLPHHQRFVCPASKDRVASVPLGSIPASLTRDDEHLDQPPESSLKEPKDEDEVNNAQTKEVVCTALQVGVLCECLNCKVYLKKNIPSDSIAISKTNDSKKLFACEPCNLRFSYKSRLNKHLKTHEGLKLHPCDICKKAFTQNKSLKNHMLYAHSVEPLKETCSICNKSFFSKSQLKRHIHNTHFHMDKICRLKCDYCEKTFSHKKGLYRHTHEIHLRDKEFQCGDCDTIFYDKNKLIYHIRQIHLPPEKYSCTICGHGYCTRVGLYSHMNKKHSTRKYNCEVCGKMFNSKECLQNHMAGHSDETPFICETCGKGFKRKVNLLQHQYTHSESRPHHCDICGQSFKLRTHVKQHMAVHGIIKNHKCFLCDQTFARKTELNSHIRMHDV